MLGKEGYQVRPAEKAQPALDSALAKPPGLILLDVHLPEMDGFELCRRLKQDKRTKHVPVIFVSALQDLEARIQGFEAGGVDFISDPFQEKEILARVRTHMSLHRFQQHLKQLVDERTSKLSESKAIVEKTVWELQESEERFRSLIEQSPMPIEILSLDGKILQSNPSWRRLWGIDEVVASETMEKYNMLTDPQSTTTT